MVHRNKRTPVSAGGDGLAYLTRNDIEQIAQRAVSAYQRLPGWEGEEQFRVDPEVFAGDLMGLSMAYHRLSPDGSILGATCCGCTILPIFDTPSSHDFFPLDGRTVLIERELIEEGANQGRYHFTLMHEAAHQLLGLIFPVDMQGSRFRVRYCMEGRTPGEDYWDEWRANALTSAILMPVKMVRRNMKEFGLGEKIFRLNKVFAPEVYDRFHKMADYMGVSLQALSIRLTRLGLLKENYLDDSYRLVNIFPEREELKGL